MATWVTVSDSPRVWAESTGNVHLNIVADKYTDEIEAVIEPYVYEIVCKYNI